MSLKIVLALVILAAIVGIAFGYFLRWALTFAKKGSLEIKVKKMILDAEEKQKAIISKAEKEAGEIIKEAKEEEKDKEQEYKKTEDRLIKKEDFLDKRQLDIDKESDNLKKKIKEVEQIKNSVKEIETQKKVGLESIASLSQEQAKEEVIKSAKKDYEEDLLVRMQKLEMTGKEKLDRKAQEILTSAIHRYGNSVAPNVMSLSVSIPSDDIKGKIIGKEGKNIRAFERATGVELLVDDTPGVITISSFDPLRRHIAKIALDSLIEDGRIQPAKIEELVAKAKDDVNKTIKEKGEQAVYECGLYNIDPRVISILGRLHFRTSYGQNVLQHSIEMAHISGVLAEELGASVETAKAGALLHDIGKAVDHEVQGTHVEIGRRILQKFGVNEEIIKAMAAHHEEYPYENIESVIVQVADAISGGRPGARRDTVENYLKRLESLESIANSMDGVEKSYALQAGREIRVFVEPSKISDLEAKGLARNLALQIEKELKYPGEIKINVIRESRTIEYAR